MRIVWGHDRERAVKAKLEDRGWLVVRAAGSFGCADLIALKRGQTPRIIEVKSTKRTFERFGPKERGAMREAAERAGAVAILAWWPLRGELRMIPADKWPP